MNVSILNKLDGVRQIIANKAFFRKVGFLSQREKLDRLYLRNKSKKKRDFRHTGVTDSITPIVTRH